MREILYFIKSIFSQSPGSANALDYDSYIIDRIAVMRESQNLTFEEIVDTFNNEELKVISGRGQWTIEMVEKIYGKEALRKFKKFKKGS